MTPVDAVRATGPDAAPIAAVALDRDRFNPSAGETVILRFRATGTGAARVLVYDPDDGLVRTLAGTVADEDGFTVPWDGRDDGGQVVPDEAYGFVIEAPDGSRYDPAGFSGGTVADVTDPVFDDTGNLSYRLPVASRVLIRLGVHNGPMYRTLVDWRPRPAGTVNETWDGFDADGLVRVREHPDFRALVTYATLPEHTVIAFGNAAESYRDYQRGRGQGRPQRPVAPDAADRGPLLLVPPAWQQAPAVVLSFPDQPAPAAVPEVKGAIAVRIDVTNDDRTALAEDQFEVILYVDGVFTAEAERGYLPLNWQWELDQQPPGEHVLSVNIASFRGQVGVASRKVVVVR